MRNEILEIRTTTGAIQRERVGMRHGRCRRLVTGALAPNLTFPISANGGIGWAGLDTSRRQMTFRVGQHTLCHTAYPCCIHS